MMPAPASLPIGNIAETIRTTLGIQTHSARAGSTLLFVTTLADGQLVVVADKDGPLVPRYGHRADVQGFGVGVYACARAYLERQPPESFRVTDPTLDALAEALAEIRPAG
jgi:hypothetical protein